MYFCQTPDHAYFYQQNTVNKSEIDRYQAKKPVINNARD